MMVCTLGGVCDNVINDLVMIEDEAGALGLQPKHIVMMEDEAGALGLQPKHMVMMEDEAGVLGLQPKHINISPS